jgi:prevent-host-death family protein
VETTGLRELRQNASDLIRRVESGETFTVTVSGRAVAELGPVRTRRWRTFAEVAEIFNGPPDTTWERDRILVEDGLRDPFAS